MLKNNQNPDQKDFLNPQINKLTTFIVDSVRNCADIIYSKSISLVDYVTTNITVYKNGMDVSFVRMINDIAKVKKAIQELELNSVHKNQHAITDNSDNDSIIYLYENEPAIDFSSKPIDTEKYTCKNTEKNINVEFLTSIKKNMQEYNDILKKYKRISTNNHIEIDYNAMLDNIASVNKYSKNLKDNSLSTDTDFKVVAESLYESIANSSDKLTRKLSKIMNEYGAEKSISNLECSDLADDWVEIIPHSKFDKKHDMDEKKPGTNLVNCSSVTTQNTAYNYR